MISEEVRVRFAPSPTGYLHVGGLRTALYNYLFARKNNGKFILRIEDTDRKRFVEGAVENLISAMKEVGLEYDEGPEKDGGHGPYFQSERLEIYNKYLDKLIESGNAYHCFCTPERLTQVREEQNARGEQAKYDKHCLSLSKEEVEEKLANNEPHVVRLNVKPGQKIEFDDEIRGHVEFSSDVVDDQVLRKTDGFPTYHLANVIDDHLMEITHVIRGEEWLSSTPKHTLLYDALGWERPVFAHLPLLLNPDKSKLSKRQGDVAVEDYLRKGYLKEALVNFVALLGWNAGDDVEYYDPEQLVVKFSLDRVGKSGAVFNVEKLNWLNFEHLKNTADKDILPMLRKVLEASKYNSEDYSDEYLMLVIEAMKERVTFVHEFIEKSFFFFEAPTEYEEATVKKRWKDDSPELLKKLRDEFEKLETPTKEDFETTLKSLAADLEVGLGKLIHPVRLATSGVGQGPGVFDILNILGKDEVLKRIDRALENIHK